MKEKGKQQGVNKYLTVAENTRKLAALAFINLHNY